MWRHNVSVLDDGEVHQYRVTDHATPLSYFEVIELWRGDAAFRSYFNSLLADSPYAAYRWETPAVSRANANRPFEFVLIDYPRLARRVDAGAFAEYFSEPHARDAIAAFPNLAGDAVLIVPCPAQEIDIYGHLASFVRGAAEAQTSAFWQSVGEALHARLDEKPVWLSTAGMGVAWLHARIDVRPKYYAFAPYKER